VLWSDCPTSWARDLQQPVRIYADRSISCDFISSIAQRVSPATTNFINEVKMAFTGWWAWVGVVFVGLGSLTIAQTPELDSLAAAYPDCSVSIPSTIADKLD
jgi:hypothetical protein